jgi:hypothetical protein
MMKFLGSSSNNSFALLDIVDCTSEMANGGEKDAKYIAGLLKPIISQIKETKDPNNQKTDHQEVVDLVLFDGASNVQNAAKIVSITYPCITIVHGAEHVVSLFFKDIFTEMPVFQSLSQFSKWCRNNQLLTVLMPSSRSTPSCTIIAFTLGSLRLVNAIWPEN